MIVTSNVAANIAPLGGSFTLQCSNQGGPNNTYEWRKDGDILQNETGDSLTLSGTTSSYGGTYNCTVQNAAGTDSSDILIIGEHM